MNATATLSPTTARADFKVMGLVGLAHCISHFCQLLLPPLFFLLKDEFHVGFAELGVVLTVFFVVSCAVQALSGFVVDRFGPRPVLFGGLALLAVAAFGYAASTSYAMLIGFAVVAGIGNGVFHPVDYTLLNRKIHSSRLGHAFAVHGITGSLGWALAPAMMVTIALASSWRVALASAGVLILVVSLIINADPLDRKPLEREADDALPTVDVFIPTYNEDEYILATTIAAAKSMDYPAAKLTVWLLDDGGTDQKVGDANQDGVEQAAFRLGKRHRNPHEVRPIRH